jgi:folylpolyglutamate synthase
MNTDKEEVDALAVQKALARTWSEIDSSAEVHVLQTIEEAVSTARKVAREWADGSDAGVMVLVTGSLHLVGGALEVLESGSTR